MNLKINLILFLIIVIAITSCTDETNFIEDTSPLYTKSVVTPYFDWENADWMPTPVGQTAIPTPWVGQGSLASIWGIDVINDRKKTEGWELLYTSFDSNAKGSLINPYFILYNKYRGLMRVYMYTTTQFVAQSSYIQDGLSVVSNYKSSMLNFMGTEWIDPLSRKQYYSQVQPAPSDGSRPLASNRWYMMQYELAYDKDLYQLPYYNVQLSWYSNYCNVTKIDLGGDINGTINSTVGSSSNNIFDELYNTGKVAATGAVSGLGAEFINKNTIDKTTGKNKLGLPNEVFKAILSGATSAITSSSKDLPGAVVNIFNSILGGTNNGTMLNLTLKAKIKMEGTAQGSGSFPSSPISFWVPGTSIPTSTVGYLPNYNGKLGIFNVDEKLSLPLTGRVFYEYWEDVDEFLYKWLYFPKIDYTKYVVINPEVKKIANVTIRKQELLMVPIVGMSKIDCKYERLEKIDGDEDCYVNPTSVYVYDHLPLRPVSFKKYFAYAVRFTIDVRPFNGTPTSTITKTFMLEPDFTNVPVKEEWKN